MGDYLAQDRFDFSIQNKSKIFWHLFCKNVSWVKIKIKIKSSFTIEVQRIWSCLRRIFANTCQRSCFCSSWSVNSYTWTRSRPLSEPRRQRHIDSKKCLTQQRHRSNCRTGTLCSSQRSQNLWLITRFKRS